MNCPQALRQQGGNELPMYGGPGYMQQQQAAGGEISYCEALEYGLPYERSPSQMQQMPVSFMPAGGLPAGSMSYGSATAPSMIASPADISALGNTSNLPCESSSSHIPVSVVVNGLLWAFALHPVFYSAAFQHRLCCLTKQKLLEVACRICN